MDSYVVEQTQNGVRRFIGIDPGECNRTIQDQAHDSTHRLPQLKSPAPLVAQLLDLFPVEGRVPGIFLRQLAGAFAHLLECCLYLILIGGSSVWNKPGDCPTVPRDHDLLATFDRVEQSPKRVLSLKGTNFALQHTSGLS